MVPLRIVLITLLISSLAQTQPLDERYRDIGRVILFHSAHAMFPDSARAQGHRYEGTLYPPELHYRDSSVALFIPRDFRAGEAVHFVVYLHGWNNNIDSAFAHYQIAQQMAGSRRNAVLVFPEGPRNAPDSYGGKLERPGEFRKLLAEVVDTLIARGVLHSANIGSVVLAGHSGAYRVMSFILLRGGLTDHICEVILFDALYGQTEKFAHWLDHAKGKFVDIFTPDGGTREETLSLIDDLAAWGIPCRRIPEASLTERDLKET
ncbi:MAG TPA: hypothetical protein VF889_01015, partial [Bacteroidota bacterium]